MVAEAFMKLAAASPAARRSSFRMCRAGAVRAVGWVGFLVTLSAALAVELTEPLTVQCTPTNAVVRWVTDVKTGTRVQATPSTVRVSIGNPAPGTHHVAVLSGLKAGGCYSVAIGTARVWLATNTFTAGSQTILPSGATRAGSGAAYAGSKAPDSKPPATARIWGNAASLPDHFARHGADFGARNPDEYARMSWEFLERAKAEGLPAKADDDGVLRVFDAKTGSFAAYNRSGSTRTFFKPHSRDYFERQPGKIVNLKNWN
jgi:hypothetical protein